MFVYIYIYNFFTTYKVQGIPT